MSTSPLLGQPGIRSNKYGSTVSLSLRWTWASIWMTESSFLPPIPSRRFFRGAIMGALSLGCVSVSGHLPKALESQR